MAGEFILETYSKDLSEHAREFYLNNLSQVVSAACLCHDVGNPAFGHSGEDAIASYFERNASGLQERFSPSEWGDFVNFEGNANAIRVLTHQQSGKDKGGAQLTHSTLVSIAKYPCESLGKRKGSLHQKKFGFFQNEKQTFTQIATNVGLQQQSETPLVYKRHPFVWLVEAADDICYNIIDMEDAHRLKIVSTSDIEGLFMELIRSENSDTARVESKLQILTNRNERISYLRAKVINALINKAIQNYRDNFELIVKGTLNVALMDSYKRESKAFQEIEAFSIAEIYGHRSVVEIENAGYNVMYELLDHFVPPILKPKEQRKTYDQKAIELLPDQFLYEQGSEYQKVLGVVDFISGMTDNFATDLYRKIKGIEIGMSV